MREQKAATALSVKTWKAFDKKLWTQLMPYSDALIAHNRARKRVEMDPRDPAPAIDVPGREAVFLHSTWLAHREITESVEALRNIPAYLNHLPKGLPPRITRYSWVRYHAENYFQELYVLQNRAELFLKQLCRAYRKHTFGSALSRQCDSLLKELKRHLEDLVKKRGEHVHQRRSDDPGLRILGLVEQMVAMGARAQRDRRVFFEDARMEKCFWMRSNNAWISKWLNSASVALARVLIGKDGALRFPFHPQ
jgi:hypothetical protein